MKLIYGIIYIFLLLKPYYFFKSGSMQISDYFLALGFIILLLMRSKRKEVIRAIAVNKEFIIFTVLTFAVNLIYFVWYLKFKFILSSLYFLFNSFAIILFSFAFENNNVIKNIDKIFKINLIIQLMLCLLNLGRDYDPTRYMGTFNDPNQFGYYVLMSYMFIYLISIKLKNKKWNFLFLIISVFLIIKSASTGMLLAICIFIIFDIFNIIKKLIKEKNGYIKIISIALILLVGCFIIIKTGVIDISNIPIFMRVNDKLSRINTDDDVSLIEERGYDRFIYYPQYILYGSGEGEYTRFTKTYHQGEIHATFPSILFYYGIMPFCVLIIWVYKKLKGSSMNVLVSYIAIFAESFTLLNQRQVIFWILILFASYIINVNSFQNSKFVLLCEENRKN